MAIAFRGTVGPNAKGRRRSEVDGVAMLVTSVVVWVVAQRLFELGYSFAGAAFTGVGGVVTCAGVRWLASRGGRWRRAAAPSRKSKIGRSKTPKLQALHRDSNHNRPPR